MAPSESTIVSPPRKSKRRAVWIVVGVVAIAAVLVVAAFALMLPLHRSPAPMGQVLEPEGSYYSLPGGQFNGIAFDISSTSVVNGTFYNTYGITLYTMTPTQFEYLTKKGVVSGYNWTSGRIPDDTITNLNLVIPPGAWDLAFVNTDPLNATLVGFYSNLTLTPS